MRSKKSRKKFHARLLSSQAGFFSLKRINFLISFKKINFYKVKADPSPGKRHREFLKKKIGMNAENFEAKMYFFYF